MFEPSSKWKSICRIYFLVYQELIQLHWLDSVIWGTNKEAKGFHAFHWCICGCPWLSMVWYTNYPPFLCHSVLQLYLFSRALATDSLACSIHYFGFVSNAAVLWILALLCFIPDLVTCVDFSRPVQYSRFSVCKLRVEFFMHLLQRFSFSLTSMESAFLKSCFRCTHRCIPGHSYLCTGSSLTSFN